MREKSEKKSFLPRFGSLACILLMVLMLLYGGWLLIMERMLSSELREAKQNFASIAVTITEIKSQEHNPLWTVVTLEQDKTDEDTNRTSDDEKEKQSPLSKTRATALKFNLSVGKKLTMYYDKNDVVNCIIDFENTQYLFYIGAILTSLPLLTFLILLIRKLLQKTKKRPIVQIVPDTHD